MSKKVKKCCEKIRDENLSIFAISKEDIDRDKKVNYFGENMGRNYDFCYKERDLSVGTIVIQEAINEYQFECIPINFCPYCGQKLEVEE